MRRVGVFLLQVAGELRKVVTVGPRTLMGWVAACGLFVGCLMMLVTGLDVLLGGLAFNVFA